MPSRVRPVGLLLVTGVLAACAADPQPAAPVESSDGTAGAAAPAATAEPRPALRTKEYATTPADHVGTLPEGLGLAVGSRAPDAEVRNASGAALRLSQVLGRGPVLIAFYRGGWCPYCNFEVQELIRAQPEYRARGVTTVAISVDRVEEAARTKELASVPFPLLSDPDLAAHEAFNVVHQTDAAERERLLGYGIDIGAASGRDHGKFAVPSLFLIDAQGLVRWAHADPDYKVRPTTAQILSAIDQALGTRGS